LPHSAEPRPAAGASLLRFHLAIARRRLRLQRGQQMLGGTGDVANRAIAAATGGPAAPAGSRCSEPQPADFRRSP